MDVSKTQETTWEDGVCFWPEASWAEPRWSLSLTAWILHSLLHTHSMNPVQRMCVSCGSHTPYTMVWRDTNANWRKQKDKARPKTRTYMVSRYNQQRTYPKQTTHKDLLYLNNFFSLKLIVSRMKCSLWSAQTRQITNIKQLSDCNLKMPQLEIRYTEASDHQPHWDVYRAGKNCLLSPCFYKKKVHKYVLPPSVTICSRVAVGHNCCPRLCISTSAGTTHTHSVWHVFFLFDYVIVWPCLLLLETSPALLLHLLLVLWYG